LKLFLFDGKWDIFDDNCSRNKLFWFALAIAFLTKKSLNLLATMWLPNKLSIRIDASECTLESVYCRVIMYGG
jgi:hypothetical protein